MRLSDEFCPEGHIPIRKFADECGTFYANIYHRVRTGQIPYALYAKDRVAIPASELGKWKRHFKQRKKSVNILALDVASNCGFAITTSKPGSYVSGTWNLSPKKDESKGMRLIRFRSKLNELKSTEPIGLVVFESAVSYGAKHASGVTVQAEMLGVLKLWCEDNGIEYKGYAPKEIKKHATGKGNANKEMMLSAARRAFGDSVKDDNEADALWLLRLALSDLK